MAANLLLPAGPRVTPDGQKEYLQRLEYLEKNGPGGIQLATARVNEPWAMEVLKTVKGWDPKLPVIWHIPEDMSRRFGFADFDFQVYLEMIASLAEPLFENGLDAFLQHCGLMKWIDDYDATKSFAEQYISDFTCREILDQIERHVERFGKLVARFGGKRVLIENCPLTLWKVEENPKRLVNFLGPQIGSPSACWFIAEKTGAGKVLDTGHFNEYWSLVRRLYDFALLDDEVRVHLDEDPDRDGSLHFGYQNVKGYIPYVFPRDQERLMDLEQGLFWHILYGHYRLFHLDSCRGTWVDGKSDMERPVLNDEDAAAIHLDHIIKVAKANEDCLGMTVENVGLESYPMLTPRPNDWDGKRLTFEFLKSKI